MKLLATLTPAELSGLDAGSLRGVWCVVFDVLRATTTLTRALEAGCVAVKPVVSIEQALAEKARDPGVLLAGERDGLRIGSDRTGGVAFDLGNSPREMTAERVRDRRLVMTTTNGTHALQACSGAEQVLAGCFPNLPALVRRMVALKPSIVRLVCSGTGTHLAWEDVLGAGCLAGMLEEHDVVTERDDAVLAAAAAWRESRADPDGALRQSANARRLASLPALAADIPVCLALGGSSTVGRLEPDGWIRAWPDSAR